MSLATAFWSSVSSPAIRATCSFRRLGSAPPVLAAAGAAVRGESAAAGGFATSAQPVRPSARI